MLAAPMNILKNLQITFRELIPRRPNRRGVAPVLFTLLLPVALLAACSSPPPEEQSPAAPQPKALVKTAAPQVQEITIQKLLELIESEQGGVLVVNFWATWCEPCVKEMPELVHFYEQYQPKGVRFLSVSADHPQQIEKSVIPFAEQMKLPFPVYVVGGESPDDLVKAIDSNWVGSLPATFLFDASGQKTQAWFEQIALTDLKGALDPLLASAHASGQN